MSTMSNCVLCGQPSDGPMMPLCEEHWDAHDVPDPRQAHAACVEQSLAKLLDPDWEPGRKPAPLPSRSKMLAVKIADGYVRPDGLAISPDGQRYFRIHIDGRSSADDKAVAIFEREEP